MNSGKPSQKLPLGSAGSSNTKQKHGGILPRKRARDNYINSSDSSQVGSFRDEDINLRINANKRTNSNLNGQIHSGSKKLKQLSEEENEDEIEGANHIDSTASQAQHMKTKTELNLMGNRQEVEELNEERLYELEQTSERAKVDFNHMIKQMIQEEKHSIEKDTGIIDIFKRKPYLNIDLLHNRGTPHIVKNKISDKFNRRDAKFYDLYVKKESGDQLCRLKDNQFPLMIDANQYYNDIEVDDFNTLFRNEDMIAEKFGTSIKVSLDIKAGSNKAVRQVIENQDLVKMASNEMSPCKSPTKMHDLDMDPYLVNLDSQLKQFEKEFGKNCEEIAEIFCKVSGRFNKMRDYLMNKPVVEWSYLEDLALTKPEDSAEFQVLLQTKGIEEIKVRREFLQATPVVGEECERPDDQ